MIVIPKSLSLAETLSSRKTTLGQTRSLAVTTLAGWVSNKHNKKEFRSEMMQIWTFTVSCLFFSYLETPTSVNIFVYKFSTVVAEWKVCEAGEQEYWNWISRWSITVFKFAMCTLRFFRRCAIFFISFSIPPKVPFVPFFSFFLQVIPALHKNRRFHRYNLSQEHFFLFWRKKETKMNTNTVLKALDVLTVLVVTIT